MTIILSEASHTCKSAKRTGSFIPMQNTYGAKLVGNKRGLALRFLTKIGHADGEFRINAFAMSKDNTVAGAVHRFKCPLLLLYFQTA